jgi:hypothetical protein
MGWNSNLECWPVQLTLLSAFVCIYVRGIWVSVVGNVCNVDGLFNDTVTAAAYSTLSWKGLWKEWRKGRTQGGGGLPGFSPPNRPKPKFKKHGFCRYDIKSFTWFPLKVKSATEVGWWQYIRISKNKLIKLKRRCDWVTEHVVIFVCI